MKIEKISVKNYRLLKDFSVALEEDLSLIIGKNNVGKTSFLTVLERFLNSSEKSKMMFDDFNVELKDELKNRVLEEQIIAEKEFGPIGIFLAIFIKYDKQDKCDRIEPLMTNLDPDNNYIVLQFSYELTYDGLKSLRKSYQTNLQNVGKDEKVSEAKKDVFKFLKSQHQKFFKFTRKSLDYDPISNLFNPKRSVDLDKEKVSLKDIINFKYISAKRDVTNRDVDKTLSSQISKLYKKSEMDADQVAAVESFKDHLIATDISLSTIYAELFKEVLEKVKTFGGVNSVESALQIISTLQHREILEDNTTVMYSQNGYSLPESYNGLGYMNLLSIIFEIEIIIKEIRRDALARPAEVNLLFIEEPEAHTHPQLQYIFIKNIKKLVKDGKVRADKVDVPLQYVISTHSAHIVAESEFNDIKYFMKSGANSVLARNLRDLQKEYLDANENQSYRFLKQYLTLSRAELFFADKAILIEGETERILMPAFMRKLDQASCEMPLMSQNISIVEVGAHSQVFEKFVDFLSIKSLVITDIDSYYNCPVVCEKTGEIERDEHGNPVMESIQKPASDPLSTTSSNYALKYFYGTQELAYLTSLRITDKCFLKDAGKWTQNSSGKLCLIFQTLECGYIARSFEDAFFHINAPFIKDPNNEFLALTSKWLKLFRLGKIDAFELAERAVKSKPSLAIEILLNSVRRDDGIANVIEWQTPEYIREGLEWLGKD